MKKKAEFDFDGAWVETKSGMELIMQIYQGKATGGFTLALWYDLYQKIYTWCTRPAEEARKEELYFNTISFFEKVVSEEETHLSSKRGTVLLKDYLKRYSNYTDAAKIIKKIFSYMHRYWIPSANTNGKADVRDMYEMARLKWREKAYFPIKSRLFDALNELVTSDRLGELADKSIVQNMVQAYIDIGVEEEQPVQFYKKEFQDPFVLATGEFYLKESTEFLQNNNVSAYMTKAEDRLAQEEALATNYLHPTTKDELIRACKNALIERHNQVLQDEFQTWLRDDKQADMKRFFNLLSRVKNGLDLSSATLKSYVTTVGTNVVQEHSKSLDTRASLKNSIDLVLEILKLYNKYTETISHCFNDHTKFVQALDEACTAFINLGVGKNRKAGKELFTMAEVLNFYVDHLLKGGEKLSEDQLEKKMEQIVRLFTYFDDKDLFYGSFRRSLSKRLLAKKFNEDAERSFIGKLKARAGDVFTKKLEGMFNDIKVSQERESSWKDHCNSLPNPPPVETTVAVLNNLYWPLQKQTDLTLPPQLQPAKDIFEKWYAQSSEKRKLTWVYHLGDCTVQFSYVDEKSKKPRKTDLICTPVQASALVAFNKSSKYRVKQLAEYLGCTIEHLKYCIYPFVFSKTRCFANRGPDGKGKAKPAEGERPTVDDADWLTVRGMAGVAQRRINIPPGVGVTSSDRVVAPVMEERALKIDLALVRVMKSRNTLQMQALIGEATKQLLKFFRPDPRMMKKRIESLVERGFMRRDEEDQRTLHYCA